MLSLATLGRRASAAAYSFNDEERRKAVLSYLAAGVPLIAWDNIPRGATIACPAIERALTTQDYSDRVLGESQTLVVSASTVMIFTGNNIAPRGDLVSRSLVVRLAVDRADPENRSFRHTDALAWTESNRARLLRALYIILLGNPRLRDKDPPPAQTRFKQWYHLVGSAIEYAARQHAEHVAAAVMDSGDTHNPGACRPEHIKFQDLFLAGEVDEEQSTALADVLRVIGTLWPHGCKASDIARYASATDEAAVEFRIALEGAAGKAIRVPTSTVITWRLKAIVDSPAEVGGKVVALRYRPNTSGNGGDFQVKDIGR
jgi:hypothetical protein